MRTILLLIAAIAIYSTAFYRPKCEHVFTKVEQPLIKVQPMIESMTLEARDEPRGKEEGDDLICVKCFHKQKQVIDYGKAGTFTLGDWYWSGMTGVPDAEHLHLDSTGMLIKDTITFIEFCNPYGIKNRRINWMGAEEFKGGVNLPYMGEIKMDTTRFAIWNPKDSIGRITW